MARSHGLDLAQRIRAAAARQVIASREVAELIAEGLELMADPPPAPTGGRELTANDVARMLALQPRTIRRYVANGRLKATRFGTGTKARLRFTVADVEAFIAQERKR